MPDSQASPLKRPTRVPWNKDKLIGPKPPLRPKQGRVSAKQALGLSGERLPPMGKSGCGRTHQ